MEVPEPSISMDQCAHALGVYMFDWDGLSMALQAVTETLLGTDALRAHITVESVQQSTIRDLLRDIGSHYLDAGQFSGLSAVLDEVRALAGVRNRLVHGRWTIAVKVHEGKAVSSEWLRVSSVTDKETLFTMHNRNHQRSETLRKKFEYSPDAIHAEALKIRPVADKLIKLAGELRVSPDHPPEPRSQRRQAARKPKGKRAH